jgi:hypothetical protein
MEDQRLTLFIEDSIKIAEAEERQKMALAESQQLELDSLINEATTARLAQTKGIPPALLPYCKARTQRGPWGTEDDIETLKKYAEDWWPDEFFVLAPGLASLSFSIEKEWDNSHPYAQLTGQYLIKDISVQGYKYQQWHQAITEASRLHKDNQEREQIGKEAALRVYKEAISAPTTAERLESLIREIAQEAVFEQVGQADHL